MEAFEHLIPEIRHLIDVPPELATMGRTMRGLLNGDWAPIFKGVSLVDQAALAVPMNAFRLTVEPYVNSGDPIPAEVLAVSETVARLSRPSRSPRRVSPWGGRFEGGMGSHSELHGMGVDEPVSPKAPIPTSDIPSLKGSSPKARSGSRSTSTSTRGISLPFSEGYGRGFSDPCQ
jgi:hypothetical protein